MTSTYSLTLIAAMAVIASAAAVARPHQIHDGDRHRVQPVLHGVSNSSQPGDVAYGWQYFSDSRMAHAVVISPSGEYFLSRGKGLRQITGPTVQASMAEPARV